MDFGLFCLMPQRDPQKSAGQIAREAVEQAVLAEEFGFDAVVRRASFLELIA